jgi:hypothetical protein
MMAAVSVQACLQRCSEPSLPHEQDKLTSPDPACPTTNDDPFRRSTTVRVVAAIGWGYVVLMMVLAEALGPGGTVLGAIVTLLLYGVLPAAIVLYIGGTRARARARREREAAPGLRDVDPGGGGEPAGDAVAPVREEA